MRYIQPHIFLYFLLLFLGLGGFYFAIVWPSPLGFYAFAVSAAISGFGVSFYIFYTKKNKGQLVCPTGSDCNAVVKSRYSKFLGVPLEHLGMAYYFVVTASYATLIFAQLFLPGYFVSLLTGLTAFAFLFSLYLIFVQAFLLRQWCIWCLLSSGLSIIIFITALTSFDLFVRFLGGITDLLKAMTELGFVLGLGAEIAAVFLFIKFLADRDIDEKELKTLQMLYELIWLGLALTIFSQISFYIVEPEKLAVSGTFLVESLALFVALLCNAVLMIIFAPFLAIIPFDRGQPQKGFSFFGSLRKPTFLTGAIAVSSWLFAFAVSYFPDYGFTILFLAYAAFVGIAVLLALLRGKKLGQAPGPRSV